MRKKKLENVERKEKRAYLLERTPREGNERISEKERENEIERGLICIISIVYEKASKRMEMS